MSGPTSKARDTGVEWNYQWSHFEDDEPFLFFDWLYPRTKEDFRDKRVFDGGCGPGHHIRLYADIAQHVTGMDLNTSPIAREKLSEFKNVEILAGDISLYRPEQPYDVVYSVGVVDHTDDPDKTFENLKQIAKPGGLVMVWVFSHEGNALMRYIVEPLRRLTLGGASRRFIEILSRIITALMYPIVYTLYLLPLKFLPFYEYLQNFRKLTFERNVLNIFDKLNSPQVQFISRERMERWFNPNDFEDVSITMYKGVSWRGSGKRKS
jgi:SAM-dependent methyltransferase